MNKGNNFKGKTNENLGFSQRSKEEKGRLLKADPANMQAMEISFCRIPSKI